MSGGAGLIRNMETQVRQNNALLNSQKRRDKIKSCYTISSKTYIKSPDISKEKLEQIKQRIREEGKYERKRYYVGYACFLVGMVSLFLFLIS